MPIELARETRERLVASIRRFAKEQLEEDMGDLKAGLVLDFALREIGPSVYNQAVSDVQRHLQRQVDDLGGVVYQREFAYWKRG